MEITFAGDKITFSPYEFVYVMNETWVCQPGSVVHICETNEQAQQLSDIIKNQYVDFETVELPRLVNETIRELFAAHGEETYRTGQGEWRKIPILKAIRDKAIDLYDVNVSLCQVKKLIDSFFIQREIDRGIDLIAERTDEPLGWHVVATPKSLPNPMCECLVGDYPDTVEQFDETRRTLWSLTESMGLMIEFIEVIDAKS